MRTTMNCLKLSVLTTSLILGFSGCDKPSPQTTATTASNTSVDAQPAVDQTSGATAESPPLAAPATAESADGAAPTDIKLTKDPNAQDPSSLDERRRRATDRASDLLSPTKPGDDSTPARQTPVDRAAAAAAANQTGPIVVKAEPANLDIGDVAAGDAATGTIKLVNTSDKPMKLIECKSSCGCTSPNCPRGREIAAGETVDIDVKMQAGQHAGPMSKKVTFIVDGQSPLDVPVKCNVITFLMQEPAELNPNVQTDGHITIKSSDGQAFTITGMVPPVIDSFDTEAKTEHHFVIDWAKWNEMGHPLKLVFNTDHPKASKHQARFDPKFLREMAKTWQEERKNNPNLAHSRTRTLADGTVLSAPTVGLLDAAEAGNLEQVKKAIADGASLSDRDASGATPLLLAAEAGKVDVVKHLLEAEANVNEIDNTGRTALSRAALKNQLEVINALIAAKADVNIADKTGATPLAWGSGFSRVEVVKALLDAGAQPDLVNVTGTTPLMWAAGFGDPASVTLLIEKGSRLDVQDTTDRGATPLIYAARQGQLQSLNNLIAAGAKVNAPDKNGRTPLAWAATTITNPVEKIEALLAAGADPNAKDKDGLTALDYGRTRLDGNMDTVLQVLSKVTAAAEATSKVEGQPAGSGVH